MRTFITTFMIVTAVSGFKGQVFYMCQSTTSSSASSGTIYDSGGPSNDYSTYESCYFLIKAGCGTNITLNFSSFDTEYGYDYLTIYNGSTTASPVLGSYWGSN